MVVGYSELAVVRIRFDSSDQKKQHDTGSKDRPKVSKGSKWYG